MKERARAFGADLVGVASLDCFKDIPAENNPRSVFPQAKSLIVIARRILRGTVRGLETSPAMGASFRHFGFSSLEDNYLARSTYDLTVWIESQGFEAVPMFGYDTEMTAKQEMAIPVAPGKAAPNVYVDWKFAAHAAGLGEIGKNGLFLSPEFGPMQRCAMLLSDFAFEADEVISPGFCEDCSACLDECPAKALQNGKRDNKWCLLCTTGAVQTNMGRFYTVERTGAACGRACLASLEKRRLLTRKYNRKFREEVAQ